MQRFIGPGASLFARQLAQSPEGKLWETPAGATPPADGQPNPNPASPTPGGTPTPQPNPSQNSQQRPAGQNGADDERHRGILADLQRERKLRQDNDKRLTQLEATLQQEQKRVRALSGVETPSEEEAEIQAIRTRFAKVFPGLAKLTDEQIERVLKTAEQSDSLEQTTQHHWQAHGRTMLAAVVTKLGESISGDLTERQQTAIKRAYAARAQEDPEFLKRHEAGDQKLIEEFVKEFVEDWFEPARRQVTADALGRNRPLPNGRGRGNVGGQQKKAVDYKDPKAVEDAMVEAFKAHGGGFGD